MSGDRVQVGPASDLDPGSRKLVSVEGRPVGVFNVEGEYYALESECPHQGGPVCTGKVSGALEAEFIGPGERLEETFSDEPAIACPWHGWEFDLETGQHLGSPDETDARVRTYEVTVDDGTLYVVP